MLTPSLPLQSVSDFRGGITSLTKDKRTDGRKKSLCLILDTISQKIGYTGTVHRIYLLGHLMSQRITVKGVVFRLKPIMREEQQKREGEENS